MCSLLRQEDGMNPSTKKRLILLPSVWMKRNRKRGNGKLRLLASLDGNTFMPKGESIALLLTIMPY